MVLIIYNMKQKLIFAMSIFSLGMLLPGCKKKTDPAPSPTSYTANMAGRHLWHGTWGYVTYGNPDTAKNIFTDTFGICVLSDTAIRDSFSYAILFYTSVDTSQKIITFQGVGPNPGTGTNGTTITFDYQNNIMTYYSFYSDNGGGLTFFNLTTP
jgi:hypothetical protein